MNKNVKLVSGAMATFDVDALWKEIEDRLLERAKAQGIKPLLAAGAKEACAFLAGAMTAMQAIAPRADGLLTDLHRPAWVIWPMCGDYPLVEIAKERAEAAAKKLVKA
jgi:hypothetical protein